MRSVCLKEELGVLQLPVYKVEDGIKSNVLRDVVVEYPLELFLNNKSVNTFLCTPNNLEELVIGFSKAKGFINEFNDVESLEIDKESKTARLNTFKTHSVNDCEEDYKYVEGEVNLNFDDIHKMMERNLTYSKLFKHTGGAHSVALFNNNEEIVICEDVARHNAMDKVIGYCIKNDISLKNKVVVLSGRVSIEMMKKAAINQIPVVVSKSAPTNLSIELAQKSNITLVGFVRGRYMNIYTHKHRIKTNI